jgi:hypothetical protein
MAQVHRRNPSEHARKVESKRGEKWGTMSPLIDFRRSTSSSTQWRSSGLANRTTMVALGFWARVRRYELNRGGGCELGFGMRAAHLGLAYIGALVWRACQIMGNRGVQRRFPVPSQVWLGYKEGEWGAIDLWASHLNKSRCGARLLARKRGRREWATSVRWLGLKPGPGRKGAREPVERWAAG